LFYTEIKNSFIHKWTAVNYIWDVTAASIAAQILILPVSIFYFNMFPVYFILGSIVAVPLVTMIIYVGTILVVMESVWADINAVLGFFMQSVMEILMRSMESIVDLPHSVVRDIYLGPLGLFLFMAAAITFLVWFKQKGLISFYVCLALLFCGIAENRWHSLLAVNQNELVVYDVRGRSQLLVDIIQGRVVHCITSLPLGHKTMRYAAGNYRLSRRIHEVIYNLYTTHEKSRAFSLRGFHGLIIPGIEGTDVSLQNRNKVNMLYITGNCWDRQHFLYQIYKPDYVVLHASLSRKEYQAWVKLQLLECFILHDARNEGAFTLKL
jgi:competence protein ComEC